jgi:hypothetical protein
MATIPLIFTRPVQRLRCSVTATLPAEACLVGRVLYGSMIATDWLLLNKRVTDRSD